MKTLKKKINSSFDNIKIAVTDNTMVITIDKNVIVTLLSFLKNYGYRHLALISCVDLIKDKQLEVIYILSAYMENDQQFTEKEKRNIMVKTRIPRDKANFVTVIDIFENAEPYERELHELFGIDFQGHPRLTPLFLELEYKIPPFRKDFDTRKFVKDFYEKIPAVE